MILSALLLAAAPAQTSLVCEGTGTVTNVSGDESADHSVTVPVRFDTTFDEAAGTLSARVPEVDYLRRIKTTNGVAVAEQVTFSPNEITAKFKHEGYGTFRTIMSMGTLLLHKRMPALTINRHSGSFAWGPHSGTCSPVTDETRKF